MCEDKCEGQEHVKDVRGQVEGDTKLQEAGGYACVICCVLKSKSSAWHTELKIYSTQKWGKGLVVGRCCPRFVVTLEEGWAGLS